MMPPTGGSPALLGVPITDGIRTVNFFNGRLLSAEDMRREQDANREAHGRLGRALGDGIVYGFEVAEAPGTSTPDQPVVRVKAGLAIDRLGEILELPVDTDVALVRPDASGRTTAQTAAVVCPPGDFAACAALVPGAYFTASGVYLLTVSPAQELMGRAPVSGLQNTIAPCNSDFTAEGVAFQLLHLNVSQTVMGNLLDDPDHLRNRLAHLMFGTEDPRRKAVERDPFGTRTTAYGFLDDLRPSCLCDNQVPLAVLYWTPGPGIQFIDLWSVRRRVTRRSATSDWPVLVADRRLAEGEAMFLQFQEQIDALVHQASLQQPTAADLFTYLPPAGLIPLASSDQPAGLDDIQFFSGLTTRGSLFIEGVKFEGVIRSSFTYGPIDLSTGEMLWRYVVRENLMATTGPPATPAQPAVLFTTGYMPYVANAQYDLAHWDQANYGIQWT